MIRGVIAGGREAIVPLALRGSDGSMETIQFAVDTGFTGFLTLPAQTAKRLMLPRAGVQRTLLGDGSEASFRRFTAWVRWHDTEREAYVLEVDGEPSLGMSMLLGSAILMHVCPGGAVEISPMEMPE